MLEVLNYHLRMQKTQYPLYKKYLQYINKYTFAIIIMSNNYLNIKCGVINRLTD